MDVAEFRAFAPPLEQIAGLCRAHGLAAPRRAERIHKGEVSASFHLELSDDSEAVLKVYCRSKDPSWLRREAAAGDFLRARTKIPLPAWSILDETGSLIGFPCLLMPRVGGIDADEVLPGADRATRARLMRRCGAALAALHQTPLAEIGPALERGLYPADRWLARTEEHFYLALDSLARQGWLDRRLLDAAEETWERGQEALRAPYEPCFLHRDYQLWNLRVDPASLDILGLLDFDAAGLGPAETDVRDLELNHFVNEPWLRREFWIGYGAPAPTGLRAERLRQSALVRALSLLAAYWGPTERVSPATVWLLLSPWTDDVEDQFGY